MDNRAFVKAAITAVFVDRDVTKLDNFFATDYIQHNPQLHNGLAALKQLILDLKPEFKYQPGIVTEAGEFVMIHGHYTGWSEKPLVAVDIFRVRNGKLVEHWDVMQEEVSSEQSANGNPMFPIK